MALPSVTSSHARALLAALTLAACAGHERERAPAARMDLPAAPLRHATALPTPPTPRASGGPVLARPRFLGVTFAEDDPGDADRLEAFLRALAGSEYWRAIASEYGVGTPPEARLTRWAERAGASLDDRDLARWVDAHARELGATPADVVIFFPAKETQVTHEFRRSCEDYAGYHGSAAIAGGARIAYAVVGRCAARRGSADSLALVTETASHEIFEAAADPFPETAPAFEHVDDDHFGWELVVGGGEPADLCEIDGEVALIAPGLPFRVQRSWSMAAAREGHDPCVPRPRTEPYFNAAPVLPDVVTASLPGVPARKTRAVRIPVGGARTIDVLLFSDAPTEEWSVSASDGTESNGDTAALGFTFDRTRGHAGDRLRLRIEMLHHNSHGLVPFRVRSRRGSVEHAWVGLASEGE